MTDNKPEINEEEIRQVEERANEAFDKLEAQLKAASLSDGNNNAVSAADKEHLNIVFIGHVDAGKSTIGGQILYCTGKVDQRTIEKYEREAKQKNRDSWFLAFILDSNEEERLRGKTVEVGRAQFETAAKRYTILDAPGHKDYVPNMIGGASQADVAVLVISARRGEFETGFERGGQTREHATLVKTLGVKQLIVVINKMDEPTVNWSKERYDECVNKLSPFLQQVGYHPKKHVIFLPVSGYTGANIKDKVSKEVCPWWDGEPLLTVLDNLKIDSSKLAVGPVRMPVNAKYKDMGFTTLMGKVESGTITKGQALLLMPGKIPIEVLEISNDEIELNVAKAGENIKIKVKGVDEDDVHTGFVVCNPENPVPCVKEFLAQFLVLEVKSIFSAGYSPMLHIHTASEECTISKLVATIDKKTGKKLPNKPRFAKSDDLVLGIISVNQPVCVERFEDFPQLGRFTLRDGKTVAIGKVVGLKSKDAPPAASKQ